MHRAGILGLGLDGFGLLLLFSLHSLVGLLQASQRIHLAREVGVNNTLNVCRFLFSDPGQITGRPPKRFVFRCRNASMLAVESDVFARDDGTFPLPACALILRLRPSHRRNPGPQAVRALDRPYGL